MMAPRRVPLRAASLALAFLSLPPAVAAQGVTAPSPDTLALLRAAVRAHPDSVPLLLNLGRALSRPAHEIESQFRDRVEAETYLNRAVQLRRGDPRVWLEYGLLVRKQHHNTAALRALKRAEQLAKQADDSLSVSERADIHEQMGLVYEVWWEDWANLPKRIEELKEKDRAAMVRHYSAAFDLDSGRVASGINLLRWLADWRKWDEYVARAEKLARNSTQNVDAWLFLGLGYHESGRAADADSAFTRAISLADSSLRTTMLDVSPLLSAKGARQFSEVSDEERRLLEARYWGERDPLHITPQNERLSEHFARVAFADLAFFERGTGVPGRETERGRLWIWYGRPDVVRLRMADPGRVVSWRYAFAERPLTFLRQLTYRHATLTDISNDDVETLRRELPELYRPTRPRMVAIIPFQAARFRGPGGVTDVEVYAQLPLKELGTFDSLQRGLFVFTMNPWQRVASGIETVARGSVSPRAHFLVPLQPGRYSVSVEALADDSAATGRDSLAIPAPAAGLSLSDLLLADSVEGSAAPRSRAELTIDGSATLAFQVGKPVGVVWEIYGLRVDTARTVRYHVQIEVRDAQRSVVVRALRTAAGLGNRPQTTLEWDADRILPDGGAAVEYTTLRLEKVRTGAYRVLITVTDRLTGASAKSDREFRITR